MAEIYTETLGDPNSEPKKFKPKGNGKKWLRLTLDVILVAIFSCVIAVSANIIYLSTSFGSSFYVNGMSMYPTLNRMSSRRLSSGIKYLNWNDGQNISGDIVDWGWSKMGPKEWKSDLKRYDIVVTYYKEDVSSYVNGNLKIKDTATLKVKRLIAFPGETIKYEHNPDNYAWGKTTITKVDGTVEVLKELYTAADYPTINGFKYPEPNPKHYGTWTLGNDEYFVMGDNRGSDYSLDSRSEGPLASYLIQGKCYLITAQRELVSENGKFTAKFLLNYLKMPWDYIHIG